MKHIFLALPLSAGALFVTIQSHAAQTGNAQPAPAAATASQPVTASETVQHRFDS